MIQENELTPQMLSRVTTCTTDRGGIAHETAERGTILRHLVTKGFIDDWQEDYVWTFMELRLAWLHGSTIKANPLFRSEGGDPATLVAATVYYDSVCSHIKKSVKVILLVVRPYQPMVIEEIDAYRQAIDKLCMAMDAVKKELAERVGNA